MIMASILSFLASSSNSNYSYSFVISLFIGISFKNIIGIRELKVSIQTSFTKLLASIFSLVTPTKVEFIKLPIEGDITPFPKLMVPVKNAKTVPSIFLGITLAKSTMQGRSIKAKRRASSKKF